MAKFFHKEPVLKFIPLGGVGVVTKNMFVYECGEDILIVDCGIGFPEIEQLGVDVVIPDISYLKNKTKKIRGIIITHGHEDHFGALPYLLNELEHPPIYSTKLVRGLIQAKLDEFGLLSGQSLHLIEPETDPFSLACFTITPFRVNHSVPDSLGFSINTPVGQIIHVSDFKFDWTPVDGHQFEIGKVAHLSESGVLCLVSDCLGSTTEGYTASEKDIEQAFEKELEVAPSQVFVTTISSNISRIQQAINASRKFSRKICFLGRSIEQNGKVAQNLDYLTIAKDQLITFEDALKLPPNKVTYIVAGCYAQSNSSLVRLANSEYPRAAIKKDAVVIFSADPIPGVYDQVGSLVDKLINLGARVVYSEIQENLHVSGHGSQGDLRMLASLAKPCFFVPIGGNPRHMRAYASLVAELGYKKENVFELSEGEILEFFKNRAKRGQKITAEEVFVDGAGVGDVGRVVLRDRQILSEEGIFVVIVKKGEKGQFLSSVDIVSRGFVYMAEAEKLIDEAALVVQKVIKNRKVSDWNKVKRKIEDSLSRFLYRKTRRAPMILPVLVEA